jgi:hypothetical protein
MAVRKKALPAKNSVIGNTIESAVSNLVAALEKAGKAVSTRSQESRKLMIETRRLKKRRLTQMSRKKRAIAADRKNSTADTRKTVRTATAELTATNKALLKTTAARRIVLDELSGLKLNQKRLSAYVKGIAAADRALAKSRKKKTGS